MGSQGKSRVNAKGFSSNYMILEAKETGFRDLLSLLVSSDLEKRDSVETSGKIKRFSAAETKETKPSLRYRWTIFKSILQLKLLMFISKPLALLGAFLEMCLNFLSNNNSFFLFIKNLFKGGGLTGTFGTLIPDRESAAFVTFIGHMDERTKLDNDIKPKDGYKYYSALCMMASKVSYENKAYIEFMVKNYWRMEYLGFYNCWNDYQGKAGTEFFLLRDKSDEHDTIVVAFRGTEPFNADDWCTDADLSWYELPGMGKVHFGFTKALGMPKVDEDVGLGWPLEYKEDGSRKQPLAYYLLRDKLKTLLSENEKTKFIVTGHSLGGALAILFTSILFHHDEKLLLERLEGVYTFGQPRVGDKRFGESMENKLKEHHQIPYFRFVYGYDLVPRMPYDDDDLLFKHFGTCLQYDRNYDGKVVPALRNNNYFSAPHVIPMRINAVLELIRSFTIYFSKGPDYKEGWLLVFSRIAGVLMVPGVSAHGTQDYVNCTRLGSSDVFLPSEENM